MKKQDNLVGVLLVALSSASFGFLPIFTKIAYSAGTSTFTLLFLRFTVAAIFMFLLTLVKKMPFPTVKEIFTYIPLGGIFYAGMSLCYFLALDYVTASTVSLLLYTYPIIVMVVSAVLFGEKITIRKVVSLCFAISGAFVIIGGKISGSVTGIVLALLSALFYAVYILISSRVVKKGQSVQSCAFIMLGAAIVFGICTCFQGFTPPNQTQGYVAVLLVALISTVVAFWSFFVGMEKTGPTIASLVSTFEPVVTVTASVIILHEPLTASLIIGGVLVLVSLVITVSK